MRNMRAFDEYHLRLDYARDATALVVLWPHVSGGTVDEPTGATVGGTRTMVSGTLPCFVHEEPARSVVRQFAEIKVGDLIVDCLPEAEVTVYPGQNVVSGEVSVDDLDGPAFFLHGRKYVQSATGNELTMAWDQTEAGEKIERTLLLSLSQ